MTHLLIAWGLLAAICLYPAGLTLALASGACALGFRAARGRWGTPPARCGIAAPATGAALVVLTLPWPGSPLAQLPALNLVGAPIGGVPLTIAGLLWLRPLPDPRSPRRPAIGYPGAVCLLMLLLALALRSPTWAAVVAAGGAGAGAGRVLVGLAALLLLPLWGGNPGEARGALTWAALLGPSLFLLDPAAASWPVWLAPAVWVAASLVAGAAAGAGARVPRIGPLAALFRGAGRIWIP